MAIANPRNIDNDHILLENTYFKLKSPVVRVNMSSQFPGKIVIGDYGLNDNPIISTYNIVDLRGGMGMWRYPSQGGVTTDLDRYWTAQNFNGMYQNGMTLGPKINVVGTVTNVGASNVLYIDKRAQSVTRGYITLLGDTGVIQYKADGAAGSFSATGGGVAVSTPSGNVVEYNGTLVLPLYSASTVAYTADPSIAAAWTSNVPSGPAGNAPDGFVSFSVSDDRLYGVTHSGKVYWTTNIPGAWSYVGQISNPGNTAGYSGYKALTFDDSSGDSTLWVVTANGAWYRDIGTSKMVPLKLNFMPRKPRYYYSNSTTLAMESPDAVVGDKLLLLRDGLNAITIESGNGSYITKDVSVSKFGLTNDNISEIYAIDTWERDLFFAITGRSERSSAETMNLLLYNGNGWHPLYSNPGTNTYRGSPRSLVTGVIDTTGGVTPTWRPVCLFIDDQSGLAKVCWFAVDDLQENPLFSTTRTYATSGYVELPVFDAGYEAQNKLALKVRIKVSHASATETVQVAYRTNVSTSSDAYTNLGSAITTNTEQILYFGTNSQGTEFKNIQFKLTMASAGSTSAPIIEYIAMDFMRLPEVLRGFTVTLDTTSEGTMSEAEMNERIWTLVNTNNLLSFAYKDNTGTERSYLVKPLSPDGVEYAGTREGGQYTLYLVELNNP